MWKKRRKGEKTQNEIEICVYFSFNQGGGAKPSLLNGNNNDVFKGKCVYLKSNKYNLYQKLRAWRNHQSYPCNK